MSKVPPFQPIRFNPNRKVDRLYFPQHGDPSLYLQCGKKHFYHESTFRTPYAAYLDNDEYVDKIKSKLVEHEAPQSRTSAQKLQMIYNNPLQSQRNHYAQRKDVLDEQIDRFDIIKRQKSKEINDNKYRARQVRLKTQTTPLENYPQQGFPKQTQDYNYQQKGRESRNYQQNIRQRLKTESYGQSTRNKDKVRFNPTFLSSINY